MTSPADTFSQRTHDGATNQPKRIDFTNGGRSGIDITYVKSRGVLYVGGWYDSFVGIEGHEISLRDFLTQLGIDRKAVDKALR